MIALDIVRDGFPIAGGGFTIARGTRTEAVVVTVTLREGDVVARGEATPYARYGETVESVTAQIDAVAADVAAGLTREGLQQAMPAGAARNAVDCALWDLDAKRSGRRASEIAGIMPQPCMTAYTISIGTPEAMREAAARAAHRPLLKIKLGHEGDAERLAAVREAAPASTLIVDANEGWSEDTLDENLAACVAANVALVEQPMPADADAALAGRTGVLLCADESAHTSAGVAALANRYQAINVKLDKAGGLTEALATVHAARANGLKVMVGCMMGSSLAMAPAVLAAQGADFVDLDAPLLLAADRDPALRYDGSTVFPPEPALWG